MDGEDVKIHIKTDADLRGGMQTRAEYAKLLQHARDLGRTSRKEFTSIGSSVKGVTKSLGALKNVISGFGIVGLLAPIISKFKDWRKSIEEAEQKLKDVRKSNLDASDAKAVRDMAEAYRDLKEEIQASAQARQRANELLDEEVRIRHEAEDAQIDAQEAGELAAVDANSPDADKIRASISARYNARRAATAASRKGEAVVLQRQKLQEEAESATRDADALSGTLGSDEKAIRRARTKAATLSQLATMRNEKDGTWYNSQKRTAEGDAERERLKAEAERAKEDVRKLEADKAAKEKEIAELRAKAGHASAKRDMLGTSLGTYEVVRGTTEIKNAESVRLADKSLADQISKRESEAKQLEIDKAEKSSAQANLEEAEQRLVNLRRGKVAMQVSMSGTSGAARRSLENANFELDRSEAALTEMIATLQSRIRKLASSIENAEKRLRNQRDADGSEGD